MQRDFRVDERTVCIPRAYFCVLKLQRRSNAGARPNTRHTQILVGRCHERARRSDDTTAIMRIEQL